MEAGEELFRPFGMQDVLQGLHHLLLVTPEEVVQQNQDRAECSITVGGIRQDKGGPGAQESHFPVYPGDIQGVVEELLLPGSKHFEF